MKVTGGVVLYVLLGKRVIQERDSVWVYSNEDEEVYEYESNKNY